MKNLRLFLLQSAFCFASLCFLFNGNAIAQNKPTEPVYRHVALMGEPAQAVSAQAEHITIEAAQSGELAAKFWRGVSLESTARYDGAGSKNALAAARNSGASLARIAPFSLPGVLQVLLDGTPQIAWDRADAQMLAASEIGGVTVSLTPPVTLKPAVWRALVRAAALHYGKDPKFNAARWEFAGTLEQAQNRYILFAQTLREILPNAPIGFRLTAGNLAESAGGMAKICSAAKVPFDSFGWTLDADTGDGQGTERVRQALAKFPALKSTRLLPDMTLSENSNPAQILTLAARLMAFAPTNANNGLLGASVNLRGVTDISGRRNEAGNALALLNRMTGHQIPLRLDRSDVRAFAVKEPGKIHLLLWREANSGDALASVRLHGLSAALNSRTGIRIQRFTNPNAPDDATDTDSGDLELPAPLGPHSFVLYEITPAPASLFSISLSSPQFAYNPGETVGLTVTLRNNGRTVATPDISLRSAIPGLINRDNSGLLPGSIAPGQSKTLRYRFFVPSLLGERKVILTAQVGAAQAALQVQIHSALAITVERPRIDQPRPGQLAQARIRLQNRGLTPFPTVLRPAHTPPQNVTVPIGAAGLSYTVDISLPVFDPGVYPVKIAIEDPSDADALESVTVYVGVPVLCHRAETPPTIDANLSDWAGAERFGMGRAEQTSGKAWKGPSDLSATAYAKWDAQYFYFACDVADDVFTPPTSKQNLTQADSVQFALSANRTAPYESNVYGGGDNEFALGLLPGGAILLKIGGIGARSNAQVPGAKVAVRRIGTHTLYEAAVPWSQISGANPGVDAVLGFAVRVNDRDGESFGAITWNSGMTNGRQPARFPPLRLVP